MASDEWLGTAVCDADWQEVVAAADHAGHQAARMLAGRCSSWELCRAGQVWVCVSPVESPLATWLWRSGRGEVFEDREVRIVVTLETAEFDPVATPGSKSRSLLLRHAYAAAFASVLAYECGAVAVVRTVPDRHFMPTSPAQPRPDVHSGHQDQPPIRSAR